MQRWYILDGKTPVETDMDTWGRWLETAHRYVADETIGPYRISTVFLGLDHNFTGLGPPILFETMVFARSSIYRDVYCDRCSTWDEAEAMHAKAVDLVKSGAIESE